MFLVGVDWFGKSVDGRGCVVSVCCDCVQLEE